MGDGKASIYNVISLVFLALTILVIVFVISRLAGPPVERQQEVGSVPTVAALPSLTPTPIPTTGLPPTFTFTPTDTLTPTTTLSPTATASIAPPTSTITDTPRPTEPPTVTPTPSVSPTPLPTETPTGPTPTLAPTQNPYLFELRQGQVVLTQNYGNSAGCAWQGLGGQVFNTEGIPLDGLKIHVFGTNFDRIVDSGSNSLYGPGGWEVPVDNKISAQSYYVELMSPGGTVVSDRIPVTFPSDCARNVAVVNFIQTRAT
ncbi:MAG: hypothetical protein LCI00_32485 [Chloroflexi bacterium]|nr:hypothetical protein [Chloroflexota bacterium]MCC6894658.1 hypothetical protein [Anaerolineae bacterium]